MKRCLLFVNKLGVGGNYVWCFVIVAIFMGLGGTKRWGCLKSSYEEKGSSKKAATFIGGN